MTQDPGNGIHVRLGDLVFAVSAALDVISPAVSGHHLRVARIAREIARRMGLSAGDQRDILLASALHDAGAFSLQERLDIMRFELAAPQAHAEAGYRLLKHFPDFDRAAQVVRFHHLSWGHGSGEQHRGLKVPLASHVVHLADRVSILPIDWGVQSPFAGDALRPVREGSGGLFLPSAVEAFEDVAARHDFAGIVTVPGNDDLRDDPILGELTLGEPELRALARLFWQLVDYRSRFTATHTSGVTAVAGFLAPLAGVTGAGGRMVAIAAGLHDLGKLGVPSEMLEKERPLTHEERATIYDHPLHGWRILGHVPGLEQINAWANFHHERLDGTGYPFHVPAPLIPLQSRIVAVADVFTALTEERPYRRGMSAREALDILEGMAGGGALDPDLVATIAKNRDEAASVRRLAQEGAFERYLTFVDKAPAVSPPPSAA